MQRFSNTDDASNTSDDTGNMNNGIRKGLSDNMNCYKNTTR